MENTITTTGDVDTTIAMSRVWSELSAVCVTPARRRLAVVPAPFQGRTLSVLGTAGSTYAGPAKDAVLGHAPISTMDVPFRTGRPPV